MATRRRGSDKLGSLSDPSPNLRMRDIRVRFGTWLAQRQSPNLAQLRLCNLGITLTIESQIRKAWGALLEVAQPQRCLASRHLVSWGRLTPATLARWFCWASPSVGMRSTVTRVASQRSPSQQSPHATIDACLRSPPKVTQIPCPLCQCLSTPTLSFFLFVSKMLYAKYTLTKCFLLFANPISFKDPWGNKWPYIPKVEPNAAEELSVVEISSKFQCISLFFLDSMLKSFCVKDVLPNIFSPISLEKLKNNVLPYSRQIF